MEASHKKRQSVCSLLEQNPEVMQWCNHPAAAIHIDLWTQNSSERSIVLCQKKRALLGAKLWRIGNCDHVNLEADVVYKDCTGLCSLCSPFSNESFRKTHLRNFRHGDDTEEKNAWAGTWTSSAGIYLSKDSWVAITVPPPSWAHRLPTDALVLGVSCWQWQWLWW